MTKRSSRLQRPSSKHSLRASPMSASLPYMAAQSICRYPHRTASLTAFLTKSGSDFQVPSPRTGSFWPLLSLTISVDAAQKIVMTRKMKLWLLSIMVRHPLRCWTHQIAPMTDVFTVSSSAFHLVTTHGNHPFPYEDPYDVSGASWWEPGRRDMVSHKNPE